MSDIDPWVKAAVEQQKRAQRAEEEIARLTERCDAYKEALAEALDIIVWMSGSPSFSPEGEAHVGWVKARDRLDRLFALASPAGEQKDKTS